MTAADLIAELQKLPPYKQVRVAVNKCYVDHPEDLAESRHKDHCDFFPHKAQDVGLYTVLTVQPEWP